MAWDEYEAAMEETADALVAHEHKHPAPARPAIIGSQSQIQNPMMHECRLRDQFATDFMQGMVATVHDSDDLLGYLEPGTEDEYEVRIREQRYDMIAEAAYRMADAMLRARAKS